MPKNHYQYLVLQVDQYKPNEVQQGCYPCSISGKVAGGPLNGKQVKVFLAAPQYDIGPEARSLANHEKLLNNPGGYLAFGSVTEREGEMATFVASKAFHLADPGTVMRIDVPIQIAPVLELTGGIRRHKSNNATMYRAFILNTAETTTARFAGDVYNAVSTAFTAQKAAFLAIITADGKRETRVLWRGIRDGQPVPMAEALKGHLNMAKQANYGYHLQVGGQIDVIPLESMMVDPETAHTIDNGLRTSLPIRDYSTGGLGGRIEAALQNVDEHTRYLVKNSFLAGLGKHARGAFDQYGWAGVWTADIKRFLIELDIEPPMVPTFGYALSTAAIKKKDDKSDIPLLTKARALGPVVSRDYVATPSDPKATERFFTGFEKLVEQAEAVLKQVKKINSESVKPARQQSGGYNL